MSFTPREEFCSALSSSVRRPLIPKNDRSAEHTLSRNFAEGNSVKIVLLSASSPICILFLNLDFACAINCLFNRCNPSPDRRTQFLDEMFAIKFKVIFLRTNSVKSSVIV